MKRHRSSYDRCSEGNAKTPLAYTIDEAVKITSISRSKLYIEIKSGRLQIREVGRRTIIPPQSLQEWLDHLPGKRN